MARPDYTEEQLMAFADGELEESVSRQIEQDAQTNPALAARIDTFRQTRDLVKRAMPPLETGKIPDVLLAAIKPKAVNVDQAGKSSPNLFSSATPPRAANDNWKRMAAAACVAVIVSGAAGYLLGQQSGSQSDQQLMAFEQGLARSIGQRLSQLPSGAEESWDNNRIRMIASFMDASGGLCREFEYDKVGRDTFVAVACRRENSWRLTFAVEAPPSDNNYAPASSVQTLDGYLSAIGVETTLTPDQEKAALAKQQSADEPKAAFAGFP